MSSQSCRPFFALSLCLAMLLIGCQRSPYTTVTGTVTHNNQPVPSGEIRFTPDTQQGNSGPAVVAMIHDGKYSTPEGKGVVGGKYTLRIMGNKAAPVTKDPTASEFGDPMFRTQTQNAEFESGDDIVHDIVIE